MANLVKQVESQLGQANFRHVHGIESLEEDQLKKLGYYRGYACAHGHLIRDSEQHWCYECAKKILSNVCGFDVNYLHADYRIKYGKLWKMVKIGFPDECWEITSPTGGTPKRVCFPSYRSAYSANTSENVNVHKAIYQCAWGDVGSLLVTRLCGNPKCANPLHMVSSFNRNYPPSTISPCEVEFKAEKLVLHNRRLQANATIDPVVQKSYKSAITNPKYVKDRQE